MSPCFLERNSGATGWRNGPLSVPTPNVRVSDGRAYIGAIPATQGGLLLIPPRSAGRVAGKASRVGSIVGISWTPAALKQKPTSTKPPAARALSMMAMWARVGVAIENILRDIHDDQLVSRCCFNATNDPTSLSELQLTTAVHIFRNYENFYFILRFLKFIADFIYVAREFLMPD